MTDMIWPKFRLLEWTTDEVPDRTFMLFVHMYPDEVNNPHKTPLKKVRNIMRSLGVPGKYWPKTEKDIEVLGETWYEKGLL